MQGGPVGCQCCPTSTPAEWRYARTDWSRLSRVRLSSNASSLNTHIPGARINDIYGHGGHASGVQPGQGSGGCHTYGQVRCGLRGRLDRRCLALGAVLGVKHPVTHARYEIVDAGPILHDLVHIQRRLLAGWGGDGHLNGERYERGRDGHGLVPDWLRGAATQRDGLCGGDPR
jgi:hypothetical protein